MRAVSADFDTLVELHIQAQGGFWNTAGGPGDLFKQGKRFHASNELRFPSLIRIEAPHSWLQGQRAHCSVGALMIAGSARSEICIKMLSNHAASQLITRFLFCVQQVLCRRRFESGQADLEHIFFVLQSLPLHEFWVLVLHTYQLLDHEYFTFCFLNRIFSC
jgi:hypothetical protein